MPSRRDLLARGDPVARERVLRAWVRREARKDDTPDADPGDWGRDRLVATLRDTYGEPVDPACRGDPAWVAVRVDGAALEEFPVFPGPGWDALSGDGTVGGSVDRLAREGEALAADFPEAVPAIVDYREALPGDLGAAVARPLEGWPPVLLEGNHRACAVHWAARRGTDAALTLHLGYEDAD